MLKGLQLRDDGVTTDLSCETGEGRYVLMSQPSDLSRSRAIIEAYRTGYTVGKAENTQCSDQTLTSSHVSDVSAIISTCQAALDGLK